MFLIFFIALYLFIYINFSSGHDHLTGTELAFPTIMKVDKIETLRNRYYKMQSFGERKHASPAIVPQLPCFSAQWYSVIDQEGETKQNSLVQLKRQILEFEAAEAGRIFRAGYIRKGRCMCVVGEDSLEDSLEH